MEWESFVKDAALEVSVGLRAIMGTSIMTPKSSAARRSQMRHETDPRRPRSSHSICASCHAFRRVETELLRESELKRNRGMYICKRSIYIYGRSMKGSRWAARLGWDVFVSIRRAWGLSITLPKKLFAHCSVSSRLRKLSCSPFDMNDLCQIKSRYGTWLIKYSL